jgi:hypothetical protein
MVIKERRNLKTCQKRSGNEREKTRCLYEPNTKNITVVTRNFFDIIHLSNTIWNILSIGTTKRRDH